MKEKSIILVLIIVSIFLVSLVGCSSEKPELAKDETTDKIEEVNESIEYTRDEIMKDFRNILKSKNEPIILVKFIDENISKVEKEDAVEMIVELEEAQIEYTDKYTDEMFVEDYQSELLRLWEGDFNLDSPDKLFLDINKLEGIKNESLKELLEKLAAGKYKLIIMEGAFYPIIDYEAMKDYNKYLNDEMKSYLDIKSMDSNKPTVLDAAFYISFDELAERLLKVEDHIKKYPEGIRDEEILRLYSAYLKLYLSGVDNTPIYNYENNAIKEDVLASYKKTSKVQDSITGEIVGKYRDIIEENNNVIDDNVLSKITECHNEAIAKLEGSK